MWGGDTLGEGTGPRELKEPGVALPAGVKLTPIEFGNLQKMDGPTEQCQDPVPVPPRDCSPGTVSPGVNGHWGAGPAPAGAEAGGGQESGGGSGVCPQRGPRLRPQGICEEVLSSWLFSGCRALVDASSYVQACRQDLCLCEHADRTSCICPTLAEYSRQCTHAGGLPLDWRGPHLCRECPPHAALPGPRGGGRM